MPKLLGRVVLFALVLSLAARRPPRPRRRDLGPRAARGQPHRTNWGTSWGGSLTISLFNFVLRRDRGRLPGPRSRRARASTRWPPRPTSARAIGRLVPYGGIGAGVYHENMPVDDDQGTTGLVFAGAKLKFPFGLVLRGEYQWVTCRKPRR